jgi:hypothetical protein
MHAPTACLIAPQLVATCHGDANQCHELLAAHAASGQCQRITMVIYFACLHQIVFYRSAYSDDAIAHHGVLKAGIELLHKPFSPETLARRVREVAEKQATTPDPP